MNCLNCNHEIADTAKFCDQCGTRRPCAGRDPDIVPVAEAARNGHTRACLSGMGDGEAWYVAGMDALAKARELLCGPKDAEIARLKTELAEYKEAWPKAVNIATIRANARREALEEVLHICEMFIKDGIGLHGLYARVRNERDASQPAAETNPPAHCGLEVARRDATRAAFSEMADELHAMLGGRSEGWRDAMTVAWNLACNKRDSIRPAAETLKPEPAVSIPIVAGPLTDVPGDPYKLTGPQTPPRDVGGKTP